MKLVNRSVLITGASSGIGAELARVLAARGARLTLAARRVDRLEALAEELFREHPDRLPPLVHPCDVTDPGAVRALVDDAAATWHGLDVLVNNAGISVYGAAERTPDDAVRRVFEVDFFGAVHATLAALEVMHRAGRGTIVTVSSLAALHGVPYLAAYGAAKAALSNFLQSLRAELDGTGIDVVTVYPSYTRTEIFDREERVGGARRPTNGYASSRSVANAVVRAIERRDRELPLTATGRALHRIRGLAPGLVHRAMARIARRLRVEEECHA